MVSNVFQSISDAVVMDLSMSHGKGGEYKGKVRNCYGMRWYQITSMMQQA